MADDLESILAPAPPTRNRAAAPESGAPDTLPPVGQGSAAETGLGLSEPIAATLAEADFARLLGTDSATLRRMAADGVMIRAGRGLYDVRASLPLYLERLRRIAARHDASAASDELKAESIRVKKAQADSIEIKNAASRGELLEAAEVERQWATILRDCRAGLLAVVSRVGAKLPHLTAHDLAEIDREIRRTLERLSDGN